MCRATNEFYSVVADYGPNGNLAADSVKALRKELPTDEYLPVRVRIVSDQFWDDDLKDAIKRSDYKGLVAETKKIEAIANAELESSLNSQEVH